MNRQEAPHRYGCGKCPAWLFLSKQHSDTSCGNTKYFFQYFSKFEVTELDSMTSSENYDLSGIISGYLDKHLVFPLLEFLAQKKIYDAAEIEKSKLSLVEKTNMVDYAVDIYQQLNHTEEVRRRVVKSAPCLSIFSYVVCAVHVYLLLFDYIFIDSHARVFLSRCQSIW